MIPFALKKGLPRANRPICGRDLFADIGPEHERTPCFAVPRYVELMDSLPKTPAERTRKYVLEQVGVTPDRMLKKRIGVGNDKKIR